jgi:hypothetical protein
LILLALDLRLPLENKRFVLPMVTLVHEFSYSGVEPAN